MAIEKISISLAGSYPDGSNVSKDKFLVPLAITQSDKIVDSIADRGKWATGLVVFLETGISDFQTQPEPYEAFAQVIGDTLEYIAVWLENRPQNAIQEIHQTGMNLTIFFDLWITQDQMELVFPPLFLLTCGRLGLKMEIISND